MRVLTFKAKPKAIFGLILLITGIVVITITFLGNHGGAQTAMATVSCATTEERVNYVTSLGYITDSREKSKEVIIPSEFNDVYNRYNEIQRQQGFDLENFKGKTAVLYTYTITNYEDNDNVVADLIVYDGTLIGADLCDTSASDGFLVALNGKTG